ncbi:peroxiredoxin [Flavobacterium album]|uniref:Peroxiredoxin n=1 Tax=Flavobacterium album TaxID=2175091 RepID=A0A2S1R1F1_9FLAO|nr:redoxin domain-containing protein [Flavobacterium album]AWH86498.1 peroxiredoxin [Flavobacterium album]
MKKFLLFLAVSATVVSCKKDQYEIAGTVDKSLNGKNVFLETNGDMGGFTAKDTVKVENGKFVFEGTATEPALYFIQVEGLNGKAEIVLEQGDIEVNIDKDSLFKSKQGGTFNNDMLHQYYQDINKIRTKMISFQKANQQAMMNAYKSNDTVVMNRLNKTYTAIGKEMTNASLDFIKKNPKAYISVLLLKQQVAMGKSSYADIKKLYDPLDEANKKTKEGKELATEMAKLQKAEESKASVEIGKQAPDFSAATPDGAKMSLKQSLGKVTLVDFWASWCRPCREENPNVVAMYNELHTKGLNIIGVSLDKEGAKWKEAIAADKLVWNQVSNLKFWDEPIAKQYGVQSIPATFLLDASGKIVAKDLRGAELKAKVEELLAK